MELLLNPIGRRIGWEGIRVVPGFGHCQRHVVEVVLDHAVLARIQADANRVEPVDSDIDDLVHEITLHVEIGGGLDLVVKLLLLLDVIRWFHGFATPAAQVVPRTPRRSEGAAAA